MPLISQSRLENMQPIIREATGAADTIGVTSYIDERDPIHWLA
jgi:hypothetical protein